MTGSNTKPLVTIITSTFNSEKYIEETIKSVINQTYTNWEWIIVDDCSDDSTKDLIAKYEEKDTRIKLVSLKTNSGGPAKPRNTALMIASGDFICFLDSDDVWIKNKIEKQLASIGDFDGVCSNFNIIDSKSNFVKHVNKSFAVKILKVFLKDRLIYFTNYININSAMIRNKKDHQFREEKEFVAIEDWIFWIEFIRNGQNIKLIPEPLIDYRVHQNAISQWNSNASHKKALHFFANFYKEKNITYFDFILITIVIRIKMLFRKTKRVLLGQID
mgnify:CR=1 FL=1